MGLSTLRFGRCLVSPLARNTSPMSSVASPTHDTNELFAQHPPDAPSSGPSLPADRQENGRVYPPIAAISEQVLTTNDSHTRAATYCLPVQGECGATNVTGKTFPRRCREEDDEILTKDKIAGWLGGQSPINKIALQHYLDFFDFSGLRLDQALRQLCSELCLKAGTRQADRILDEFGRRYWDCNPTCIFGSATIAHIVSSSLLLLDDDLHTAETADKMSRTQFVRNTITAIQDDSGGNPRVSKSQKRYYRRSSSSPMSISPRASASVIPNGQGPRPEDPAPLALDEEWMFKVKNMLKDMYNAVKSQKFALRISRVPSSPTSTSHEGLHDTRKDIGFAPSLTHVARGLHEDDRQHVGSHNTIPGDGETIDEELSLRGPPWAKEGRLSHRHYAESPEKGVKSTTWVDVFVVVQKGELSMFEFENRGVGDNGPMGDGNRLKKAKPLGRVQLAYSLAQALPAPGFSKRRPHCMVLTLADGSVSFFQAETDELVREWVSTCNYWAARRSKEPLAEGVSNMEYGWNRARPTLEGTNTALDTSTGRASDPGGGGEHDGGASSATADAIRSLRNDHIVINDWKPPMTSPVASTRTERDQLKALQRHVSSLKTQLQEHNGLLQSMTMLYAPRSSDAAKAEANWEKRSKYLLSGVVKYKLYIETLQLAMRL